MLPAALLFRVYRIVRASPRLLLRSGYVERAIRGGG